MSTTVETIEPSAVVLTCQTAGASGCAQVRGRSERIGR